MHDTCLIFKSYMLGGSCFHVRYHHRSTNDLISQKRWICRSGLHTARILLPIIGTNPTDIPTRPIRSMVDHHFSNGTVVKPHAPLAGSIASTLLS